MQVIAAYVDCGANDCTIRDQGCIEKGSDKFRITFARSSFVSNVLHGRATITMGRSHACTGPGMGGVSIEETWTKNSQTRLAWNVQCATAHSSHNFTYARAKGWNPGKWWRLFHLSGGGASCGVAMKK